MKTIILGMIGAVADLIPEMVIIILDLITAVLVAIGEALPDLIQAGYDILLALIDGVADNIADVVAAGLSVLTEFMAGIEEGIPELVDQAFSTILTFLEAVADAIEEYMPQIVEAGLRIGEGIIDGLVDAIIGGLAAVKGAVIRIAQAALESLGLGFLWGSPSKKTYEIGEGFVEGFVNGVLDGIRQTRKAMSAFAQAAADGVNPILDAVAADIDKRIEFNPIIRPILDLDNIDSGVMALNKSFNNSRVLAELSYTGQLTSGTDSTVGPNGSDSGVTFIQNNYSPKALDRETIYRQTRTQVAKLSERAFE
jgi:phage-related protein